MSQFDEEFDDQFDVAEFDEEGVDHDSEPTVTCSNCGFEMLEIAYKCPRCGEIPTREFRQAPNQPRWVVLTALLLLGLLIWWILG